MRFSNGCWLQKEGCACFSPAEVYSSRIENNKVTLIAPTHKIVHRGDTLGGVNLTVEITAPAPEVIRVRTWHYKGTVNNSPAFELNLNNDVSIDAEETENEIIVRNGHTSLVITKANWSMTYYYDDKKMTGSAVKDLAYMRTNWKGDAYVKSSDKDAYMRQQLTLSVGELIYGLGERFSAFVKNGQSVDIWNEDGGTSTDQSYKNIPFYLSNRGYGVFVNHPEKVSYEIATEAVNKVEFSVAGESLDYFFIGGPEMKDVIVRYTDLTGKPALPPAWTFGLWLSTSFTTNYDEETVMSFIDGMLDRGIPLKVFHFDC
ncbi:MAG: TIM-barrel domain-containing protein, partial [Coprococcus sp.]